MPRSFFITVGALMAALLASWAAPSGAAAKSKVAIFAGGCFWCVEADFDKVSGVIGTTSGYIGGSAKTASYKRVSGGGTGHYEAVKIVASSGFNVAKCKVMGSVNAPIDIVGTGSFLPEIWPETYATADIVAYDGKPTVKLGREFLLKK